MTPFERTFYKEWKKNCIEIDGKMEATETTRGRGGRGFGQKSGTVTKTVAEANR